MKCTQMRARVEKVDVLGWNKSITRRAYNVPVTFHGLAMRANNKRLRLKRVEWRLICHEELLAIICQDICDEVRAEWGAALADDFDDGWLEGSDSD